MSSAFLWITVVILSLVAEVLPQTAPGIVFPILDAELGDHPQIYRSICMIGYLWQYEQTLNESRIGIKFSYCGVPASVDVFLPTESSSPNLVRGIIENTLIVMWGSLTNNTIHINQYDRFAENINPSVDLQVNTTDLRSPQMLVVGSRYYVLTWQDGEDYVLKGQLINENFQLIGEEFLISSTQPTKRMPAEVTPMPIGFVSTWQQLRNGSTSDYEILASLHFEDGSRNGEIFRVSPDDNRNYTSPQVAVFVNIESIVFIWKVMNDDNYSTLYGTLYDTSTGVLRNFRVSGTAMNSDHRVTVCQRLSMIYVVWVEKITNTTDSVLLFNEFRNDGFSPDSPQMISMNWSTTVPGHPSVAEKDFGFQVVWSETFKNGSRAGIYSELYTPPEGRLPVVPSNRTSPPAGIPTTEIPTSIPTESSKKSFSVISVILFSSLCLFVVGVLFGVYRRCRGKSSKLPTDELAIQLSTLPPEASETLTETALQPIHEIDWSSLYDFKVVGKGAFGIVRTAWSNVTREQIAIKESHTDGEDLVEEVRVLCSLRQKNILNYYGWARHEGTLYMITEYCSGGSLLQFKWKDRMTQSLAVTDIARALSYLETLGLVHMDVSARNVLAMSDGMLKLSDMGLLTNRGGKTKSKLPIQWCSPTTLKTKRAYTSQDIWSYGCLLYEVLSGHAPFYLEARDGLKNVARKIVNCGLPSAPSDLNRVEQLIWDTVVVRCWDTTSSQISFRDILLTMEKLHSQSIEMDSVSPYFPGIEYETVDVYVNNDFDCEPRLLS